MTKKIIISFLKIGMVLYFHKFESLSPRMFFKIVQSLAEIGQMVLDKKIFGIDLDNIFLLVFIFHLKRAWPFIWTNLNPVHPRMFCDKFGWNWTSGSGDRRRWKFEKFTTTTATTTENGQISMRKAYLSFSSGELISSINQDQLCEDDNN